MAKAHRQSKPRRIAYGKSRNNMSKPASSRKRAGSKTPKCGRMKRTPPTFD